MENQNLIPMGVHQGNHDDMPVSPYAPPNHDHMPQGPFNSPLPQPDTVSRTANGEIVDRPHLPIQDSQQAQQLPQSAPMPNSVTYVRVVGLHGGAGASRLCAYVSSMSRFSVAEVPFQSEMRLADVADSLRVVVVRATDYGSAYAFKAVEASSAFTVVAAVEDGIIAPRVPHIAKARFKAISVVAPVVYIPYVSDWRYESTAPASNKYKKALGLLIAQLENLEKYIGRNNESYT